MPRTGRPAKPVEQKRLLGNPGKRALPAALAVLPAVDIAVIADGPIVAALVEAGVTPWIGATDAPTVRLAQRLWDDMERMRSALDDEWNKDVHAAYIATIKELRSCLSLLGLSPSDRSRLGVAEVKARSKLEELMDRRGRRVSTPRSTPEPSELAMAKTS